MLGREKFIKLIESNIEKHGYHITVVSMSDIPRFAYSIGLMDILGFELILAGGIFYMRKDISVIFNKIVTKLKLNESNLNSEILTETLGSFTLRESSKSWCEKMMLGVYDYLKIKEFKALQIIPDHEHYTSDIPDMDKEYQESEQPIWKWLTKDWTYPVPNNSTVTTNLSALKGETITEVMRWEKDYWEMFTMNGNEVPEDEVRIVSLGTILGIDDSILPTIHHEVEEGMWRNDKNSKWNKWK